MSGAFNDSDALDGGWAHTKAKEYVGFVGVNYAQEEPRPGGVGGSGLFGLSYTPRCAGVFGANNSKDLLGVGVQGNGPEAGVSGYSTKGHGVRGFSTNRLRSAVYGSNNWELDASDYGGFGIDKGTGVLGTTSVPLAAGVFGENRDTQVGGVGVYGVGLTAGLQGYSGAGQGLVAQSQTGSGAVLTSDQGQGLTVFSFNNVALFAEGALFAGVFNGAVAVSPGPNTNNPLNGSAVITEGHLFVNNGSVFVGKGDVLLGNADCAEEFDVSPSTVFEAGSVMVLDECGDLQECALEYDKRAMGVVSGAGIYRPAIILDRQPDAQHRAPLALIGKVYCKVDAEFGEIEVGDLLTTSATNGHARKATDPIRGFGAVIGKALEPLSRGRGLIRVLAMLR